MEGCHHKLISLRRWLQVQVYTGMWVLLCLSNQGVAGGTVLGHHSTMKSSRDVQTSSSQDFLSLRTLLRLPLTHKTPSIGNSPLRSRETLGWGAGV